MKETIRDIHNWLETAKPEFGSKVKLDLSLDLVYEEANELKIAIENNDRQEIIDAVCDSIWVLNNITYYYGITPDEISNHLYKVKKSNFSKFCQTLDDVKSTVKAYKEGTHPSKPNESIDTYYKETGNAVYPYVVLRKSDDKILKSLYYVDVADLK